MLMGINSFSFHHSPTREVQGHSTILWYMSPRNGTVHSISNRAIPSLKYPCDDGELGARYGVPSGLEGPNGHPQADSACRGPSPKPHAGCSPCLGSLVLSTHVITHFWGPLCLLNHSAAPSWHLTDHPGSPSRTSSGHMSCHGLRSPVWGHWRSEAGSGWEVTVWLWTSTFRDRDGPQAVWVKGLIWGFKMLSQGRDHKSSGVNEEIRSKDRSCSDPAWPSRRKGAE